MSIDRNSLACALVLICWTGWAQPARQELGSALAIVDPTVPAVFSWAGQAPVGNRLSGSTPEQGKAHGSGPVIEVRGEEPATMSASAFSAATQAPSWSILAIDSNGLPQAGWSSRNIPVGSLGTLSLVIPNHWRVSVQPPTVDTNPCVVVRCNRQYGDDFMLQIVTTPVIQSEARPKLQEMINTQRLRASTSAVEKNLKLLGLDGPDGHGSYFSYTDSRLADKLEPTPGTYKFQTQGMLELDGLSLNFVILSNYSGTFDPVAALEVIRTAKFSKPDSHDSANP